MDNWVLNTPLKNWPLYESQKSPIIFRFFESKTRAIVLSSSNKESEELNLEYCKQTNIPILRRRGGGGTVVLGPGCLILTFSFYAKDIFSNAKYFHMINDLWINALSSELPVKLSQNGISDICYQEKKVAGTSIFRKKNLLVYQGSMLVEPDLSIIGNYLAHPSKEPEYRKGRPHKDFLTCLKELGCQRSTKELALICQKFFLENAPSFFENDIKKTEEYNE